MSNIFLEIQHPFLSQLFWASPEGFARLLTCFDVGLHGVTTLDALYIQISRLSDLHKLFIMK
jgi:hypothetical protein